MDSLILFNSVSHIRLCRSKSLTITRISNSCIEIYLLPELCKQSMVLPLARIQSQSFNDFCPISVLSPLAKCFEIILNNQILIYVNKYNLLIEKLSGFQSAHSTRSA